MHFPLLAKNYQAPNCYGLANRGKALLELAHCCTKQSYMDREFRIALCLTRDKEDRLCAHAPTKGKSQ